MDLRFLTDVMTRPGPFATVYLDASHDTADAARQDELRRAAARKDLADQGADERTLAALDRAADGAVPPTGRAGRVLVAAGGEVLLDRVLPAPPERPSATWSPLPDLLPLLVALPEPTVAVVVRIDEKGGEILLAGAESAPVLVEQVDGRDHPVHKVGAGGPSHLAMQERVEETWRRNTADVAARVDAHVAASGAGVVVLAGDAPARSRLRDALSTRAASVAVDVEHTGGPTDLETLAAAVREAVLDAVDARRHAVIDRYAEAAGRDEGFAVSGLEAVLAALRAEQVDTLLVDAAVPRDTEVWFGDPLTAVARDAEDLRRIGGEPAGSAPADAVLVRAAVGGDAAFHPLGGGRTGLVGHEVTDGVAALLRYPFVGTG
ncbi:MAG: Vms1/Ankzf1 family peptidyl-tRNA hydrolase [Pseudonocardiales bacterium]|jgi:hypothetical protein|nr:Vms1/Ankzf1 family peptidyl-tRNA hydrolase [Pseudonocardiales bacterium]